jgi:hypothetical protein
MLGHLLLSVGLREPADRLRPTLHQAAPALPARADVPCRAAVTARTLATPPNNPSPLRTPWKVSFLERNTGASWGKSIDSRL